MCKIISSGFKIHPEDSMHTLKMNSKCTYLAGLRGYIVDLRIFAHCVKVWLPFYAIILQIALLLGYLFEGSEAI